MEDENDLFGDDIGMEDEDDLFGDDIDDDILDAVAQVEEDENPSPPTPKHLAVLQKYFGHTAFKDLQWKIIHSLMVKKKDQLTIMATGYGKSLIYQVVFLGPASSWSWNNIFSLFCYYSIPPFTRRRRRW